MPELPSEEYRPRVSVKVDDSQDFKDLSVGDNVTLKVTGRIVSLSEDEETEKNKKKKVKRVSIEQDSVTIEGKAKGSRKDSKTPMEEAYDESQSKGSSEESSKAGKEKEE